LFIDKKLKAKKKKKKIKPTGKAEKKKKTEEKETRRLLFGFARLTIFSRSIQRRCRRSVLRPSVRQVRLCVIFLVGVCPVLEPNQTGKRSRLTISSLSGKAPGCGSRQCKPGRATTRTRPSHCTTRTISTSRHR
jgi:hypothetical protein